MTSRSGFELFFIIVNSGTQNHFIFRRQLSSTVHLIARDEVSFRTTNDQLLVSLEIYHGECAMYTIHIW